MKQNYLKNLFFIFVLLYSIVDYAQYRITYGASGIIINNTETIDIGSSGDVPFAVENLGNGNSRLKVENFAIDPSNFGVFDKVGLDDIRPGKDKKGTFRIKRTTNACNSAITKITIEFNGEPDFVFYIKFDYKPSISIQGGSTSQPIPNGQTNATSTNGTLFGNIDVDAATTRNFVIVNTGTCPLTLDSYTCFGYAPSPMGQSEDFTVIALTATSIEPGSYAVLVVRFIPKSAGSKSAIITIQNNDKNRDPYTFVISGEGYNPNVTGPGGGNPDFRLWLKSTRGISLDPLSTANNKKLKVWEDLGSTGKDAEQFDTDKQPTYVDAANGNINFNPVVKFVNDATYNQFMENIDNGYYTQETFIVMEQDIPVDGTTTSMTIISGTTAISPSYSIIPGEHTGIGFGDFSSRLIGEKLWFNQGQSSSSTPNYSVTDGIGDYTKAGIINLRNKTVTGLDPKPSPDGVELLFNNKEIGTNITPYSNLGDFNSATPPIWVGSPYNIGKNLNAGPTAKGNLNGRVAEIISYASRVLPINRPKIESYLAIKYGITLGENGISQNYYNSYIDPVDADAVPDPALSVIWDNDIVNDHSFNFNIAGIGKDVASDLHQKQSKSGNDPNEVTIGLGVIANTNNANINQFENDRNFLVWGSDNGTYAADGSNTATLSDDLTTTVTKINKKWKIVETGGDVGNIFIGIPEAALSGLLKSETDEEYALIVSSDPAFADADIIDVIPLKTINGLLQTWYDFDGTKYFTFGKVPKVVNKELVSKGVGDGNFLVGEYALNLNSGSFTIGCWLRNDGAAVVGVNKTIMAKGINLELRLNADNKIEALWDGVLKFVSNTSIGDNKWHNVVAVYYFGSADLYIDGVLDFSTFNLTNPRPNNSRYSVGALYANKSDIRTPFYGEIDEIHIWNRGLTSNQINYLMNQEIAKHSDGTNTMGKVLPQDSTSNEFKTIPWTELVAYYDFNVFYGTTVEGLTADRNFLRIKYLNKDKNITGIQTAPLPYETIVDGPWNEISTWKNGSVQKIPNDISIVNSGLTVNGNIVKIKNNVTSVRNKTVLGLIVEGTDATTYKTLSAINDTKIEVSNYLKLDGLIDLTGHSQLVQTLNSDLDPSSLGFIKRDQQGTSNRFNYNYWSSPVGPINAAANETENNKNYTVSGVFKDGTAMGDPKDITWIGGYNGSVLPLKLARYWLYKFENGATYANWKRFKETDGIKPSQGFTLKGAGEVSPDNLTTQNYTFKGKPYNGLIDENSVLPNNFFLVGNPYPSSLDAFEFIRDNISIANFGHNIIDIIDGTLYFWQHSPTNNTHFLAGYTGGYAELNLTGGTPPTAPLGISGKGTSNKIPNQYIPIGQAFFVNGSVDITTAGGEKIIFNNNQRAFVKEDAQTAEAVDISNTMFKNSSNNSKTKMVGHFNDNSNDVVYNNYNTKIRLGFNTANRFHRQLLLGFMNEDATDGVDIGYDGYQIDTQKNDSYFLIKDTEYSIQGVGSFDVNNTYPLGVKTDSIGTVQFMVDATEFLPENISIWIHDKELAIFHDITKDTIEVNLDAGTYNSRFELTFKTEKSAVIDENVITASMLLIYNNEVKKKLFVTKNQEVTIKEVTVYNILGQLLISVDKVIDLDTIEIPFNVQRGAYIVKVNTDKGTVSQKVLKQ